MARYERQAPSPHGSLPPVPGDKVILHPPHSPNSVKAGPRPPTGDTVHRADALLTHPVALGSCEATQREAQHSKDADPAPARLTSGADMGHSELQT